uniref:Uncharacterized protein n=1 Tax=Gossypium raimondii TaxID=29730 RepID=A0A0D2PSD4_GOSRA|nr:hypothetical protein B456_005G131900 [Gossypium raimondii]
MALELALALLMEQFDKSSLTWKVLWDWTMAFPWQPALYTGLFSTELCLWIEIPSMCEGASFAWFLLGERWGTTKWIGVALVLGNLMVQIFGSSTIVKGSIEVKKGIEKGNLVLVSQIDKGKLQKKLSTSPIVVRPRKDPMDVF